MEEMASSAGRAQRRSVGTVWVVPESTHSTLAYEGGFVCVYVCVCVCVCVCVKESVLTAFSGYST